MEVVVLLVCATLISSIEAIKKCRNNCDEVYKPVCGHDPRLGYYTFCSADALDKCNFTRGNNYTKIADGPCYPSVRDWKTQPPKQPEEDSEEEEARKTKSNKSVAENTTASTTRNTPSRKQEDG